MQKNVRWRFFGRRKCSQNLARLSRPIRNERLAPVKLKKKTKTITGARKFTAIWTAFYSRKKHVTFERGQQSCWFFHRSKRTKIASFDDRIWSLECIFQKLRFFFIISIIIMQNDIFTEKIKKNWLRVSKK